MTGPAISATRSLIELSPENVAQHPDNLRDPGRDLKALTASVKAVGVLVPLIVVPVAAVPGHEFDSAVTHVAVDGNRRQAAARAAGIPLPCEVRPDLASARDSAVTMAVTGLVRDGLTAREEAGAVQTMLDLGISPTAIGRATGRSRAQIGIARKAASITETWRRRPVTTAHPAGSRRSRPSTTSEGAVPFGSPASGLLDASLIVRQA